jgi:hypothetical protein
MDCVPPLMKELKGICCHTAKANLGFNDTRDTSNINLCSNEKEFYTEGFNKPENDSNHILEMQQASLCTGTCPPSMKQPYQTDSSESNQYAMDSRDSNECNSTCHKHASSDNDTESHQTLSEFLEEEKDEYFHQFLLPEKVLSRFALVLGKYIVNHIVFLTAR